MATPLIRFGAFRLDPQARELFENGERVDLPLSTIDCLIHLIRHRDRPVGRDELASAVWGRVDVSEVSLSHAIVRLRRRFGVDGGLFASAPGFTDSGKWRVEDGKLCGSLRKIGEFCNEARFDAGTLFLRRMSGEVIRYVPN